MRLAILVFSVIAVILISETESAVVRGYFKNPAHPGKCVINEFVLEKGQTMRHPEMCVQIVCKDYSEAEIKSCGDYGLPPGKKFGKYTAPNADYPDCCDRV